MKKIILGTLCSFTLISASFAGLQTTNHSPINVSFVQSATSSKFATIDATSGVYKLTLKNVNPRITYFSDRPNRVIGQFSTQQYLAKWKQGKDSFNADAPNAVLNAAFHDANDNDQFVNVFVTLSKPVYNANKNIFTYEAKLLNDNRQPLTGADLHHAVLFIDEACLSCVG